MRRISPKQWVTIIFVLMSLNCLVAVVAAWLVFGSLPPQTESSDTVALPATAPPIATHTSPPSSTRTDVSPLPSFTPGPPAVTPTLTPYIIYATATFTPTPSDTRAPISTGIPSTMPTSGPAATLTARRIRTATATREAFQSVAPTRDTHPGLQVKALSREEKSLALLWQSESQGPYDIFSDMGTGFGLFIRRRQVTTAPYSDSGLWPGTTYRYIVVESTTGDGRENDIRHGEITVRTLGKATRPAMTLQVPVPPPTSYPLHLVDTNITPAGTLPVTTSTSSVPVVTMAPLSATPLPADTILLSLMNATEHLDDLGNVVIVGEIRNDSPYNVTDAQVVVTFYNARGEIIQKERTRPLLTLVKSHERSPFSLSVPNSPNLWEWSLQATAHPTQKGSLSHLMIKESRAYEDDAGLYHVTGTVLNNSDNMVSLAQVVVTLYDRLGKPINAGFAYTDPYTIENGEEGNFDCTFSYYPRVKNYTIQVEWD
jgi:hypothetical protein